MKDNGIIPPLHFSLFSIFVISFLESLVHVDMRQSQGHPFTVSDMTVEPTITVDLMQVRHYARTLSL